MNQSSFECDCCREGQPGSNLGGYIGIGVPASLCISCFRLYQNLKLAFPDKTVIELLDSAKTFYALDRLTDRQKTQMKRLVFLINNDSRRAHRLVAMALDGQISVAQLLSMI